jgi:hypothetical protein
MLQRFVSPPILLLSSLTLSLCRAAEEIECGMSLLGAVGIEDELQVTLPPPSLFSISEGWSHQDHRPPERSWFEHLDDHRRQS